MNEENKIEKLQTEALELHNQYNYETVIQFIASVVQNKNENGLIESTDRWKYRGYARGYAKRDVHEDIKTVENKFRLECKTGLLEYKDAFTFLSNLFIKDKNIFKSNHNNYAAGIAEILHDASHCQKDKNFIVPIELTTPKFILDDIKGHVIIKYYEDEKFVIKEDYLNLLGAQMFFLCHKIFYTENVLSFDDNKTKIGYRS